jgi:hypothetical protein
MTSLHWLKKGGKARNLAIVLLFGLGLLTLSATNVMAVEKEPSGSQAGESSQPNGGDSTTSTSSSSPSSSSSSSPSSSSSSPSSSSSSSPSSSSSSPSSSSSSSPSSSHSHSSSHHKSDYGQGSAAGANDGKVGVYDLAAACPSGSSACADGYKHSYVETCTKSSFGCGDGPSTLGSTASKSSSHHHSTTTTNTRSTSSATSSPPQKNITNLLIRVVTDNQTSWDGSYCCTPGTLNTQFMGNLSSPYTGVREFAVTCSGNFSAMAKIDSSVSNPPHLTVSVLDNDTVIGSQTTNTTNTNATVKGKC